jgi:GNAT superfamily N-acetyltransferase
LITDEPHIRAATAADVPAIADVVDQAYRHYIARMGKPPGPMLDDYAARVLEGLVWVLEEGSVIAGIIVLRPATDYLLLDNIAVSPARQGLGLGRRLLAFAEAEALRRGYPVRGPFCMPIRGPNCVPFDTGRASDPARTADCGAGLASGRSRSFERRSTSPIPTG